MSLKYEAIHDPFPIVSIQEATASVTRRLQRFGPPGDKRPFYEWKNNNVIRAWDRGSKYLHGVPNDLTPALLFTIYLYRHYINDADTFHQITRIYKQLTVPDHYLQVKKSGVKAIGLAGYLIEPAAFDPAAYENACKSAFLIRGSEPSSLLTGSHGVRALHGKRIEWHCAASC